MMNNISASASVNSKSSKDFDLKEKINEIPDKLGFKIGEVAQFVGVKSYVLRYWESEFESLNPKKSQNGQRFYTRKDIEMALTIRKLLYEDRFSIEGAKSALKKMKSMARSSSAKESVERVVEATEAEILHKHKPAAEIVLNRAKTQATAEKTAKQLELHQKLYARSSQKAPSDTLAAKSQAEESRIHQSMAEEQPIHFHELSNQFSQSSLAKSSSPVNRSPTQEALLKREKEITQFWVSSIDYLVEEIRQARKRLAV